MNTGPDLSPRMKDNQTTTTKDCWAACIRRNWAKNTLAKLHQLLKSVCLRWFKALGSTCLFSNCFGVFCRQWKS